MIYLIRLHLDFNEHSYIIGCITTIVGFYIADRNSPDVIRESETHTTKFQINVGKMGNGESAGQKLSKILYFVHGTEK